jgi:hypothetical protein
MPERNLDPECTLSPSVPAFEEAFSDQVATAEPIFDLVPFTRWLPLDEGMPRRSQGWPAHSTVAVNSWVLPTWLPGRNTSERYWPPRWFSRLLFPVPAVIRHVSALSGYYVTCMLMRVYV